MPPDDLDEFTPNEGSVPSGAPEPDNPWEIEQPNFTGGGVNTQEAASLSTIIQAPDKLHHIYLANSDPATSFTRMINVLLDNYIYYVTFSGNAPLPADSIYGAVDPLGLSGQFGEIMGAGGVEGRTPMTVEVVEINSVGGQELLRNYHAANGDGGGEKNRTYEQLNDKEKAKVDAHITGIYAGHEFMFLAPEDEGATFRDPLNLNLYDDPETDVNEGVQIPMIGIVPSYDGTNMGYISTIEEWMMGVPLDQKSLDYYMRNLETKSPDMFRAVQGQLSALGYYNTDSGGPEWGYSRNRDRQAFRSFMADIITERVRVEDYNRKNPNSPISMARVGEYLDKRFFSNIEANSAKWGVGVTKDADGNTISMSPMRGLQNDVQSEIVNTLNNLWNGTGRQVGDREQDIIEKAFNELYVAGDIDPTEYKTEGFTDLMGLADSFGAEYYGGQEGWENNIRIGIGGNRNEFLRMARAAGVPINVDEAPTAQQRKDIYRWNFITLLNKNNGNFEAASNEFANTFGAQTFRNQEYNSDWLRNVISNAQTPTSFGHVAGAKTMLEQDELRLGALDDITKRVQVASGFGNEKSGMARKAANDVLAAFASVGKGNQRDRGTRI